MLYLSFFPEDEDIEPDYLVYLWIAEGFIPAGDDQLDMAWNWLEQHAQLCLVELWQDTSSHEFLNTHCKVHDLLHDLAIHISRENRCAFSVEEATPTIAGTAWCLILLAKKDIDNRALSRRISPENRFNDMRGLRVLDLRCTRISALPACVGKMIVLKDLNLWGTMIKELPECVRNLKGLLFLAMPRIENWDVCLRLPKWITELERLQHLEVPNVSFGPRVISKMVSLRTLRSMFIKLPIVEELSKLTLFRKFEQEILQFPETMRGMKHLEKLMLNHFAVPSWISDLVSIRDLLFSFCEYSDFPEFERMPDLVKLELASKEGCKEFPKAFGVSIGFPRLRFLRIADFNALKEFPQLEEGAMPYLEGFKLARCGNLIKLWHNYSCVTRLFNVAWDNTTLRHYVKYFACFLAINVRQRLVG